MINIWRLFNHDTNNELMLAKNYLELGSQERTHKHLKNLERLLKIYDQFMRTDKTILTIQKIIDDVNKTLKTTNNIEIDPVSSSVKISSLFFVVFFNLIKNSKKHSSRREENLIITIKATAKKIVFCDNGKGIKNKKTIFKPNHALYIIRQIGKEIGFTINETGSSKGACFEIILN